MRSRAFVFAAALACIALGACSSSTGSSSASSSSSGSAGSSGDCPNDLPTSCPSPEPSYANDVVPVITRACKNCHFQGGLNQDQLFDTFDEVHAQRGEILTQVNSCRMPPADAGALSEADRQTLLGWLVCGANDN